MKFQKVKGTIDYYPKDMHILNHLKKTWQEVSLSFGYEEFDSPVIEHAELIEAKSGQELTEQVYSFTDKGGSRLVLRPELTPSLARMIAEKQMELTKPIKWFSIPKCFRYERPQAGREREFYQFNLDCLGVEGMQADSEVITTLVKMLIKLNLGPEHVYIRISNRAVVYSLLKRYLSDDELRDVARLIDKKSKIGDENFKESLKTLNLNDNQIEGIINVISIKDIDKINYELLDEKGKLALNDLKLLFTYLSDYEVLEYCELDFELMRGLDYYTSTVFEAFDRKFGFRAIAGGGRYDDLVKSFGGDKCPGVGFGFGNAVISLLLDKLELIPKYVKPVNYYIATVSEIEKPVAIKLSQYLRAIGNNVEIDVIGRKLQKQLDYSKSIGAVKLIVLGPDEIKQGYAIAKNSITKNEELIEIKKFIQ